jgi:hypothetical protein
MTFTLKLWKTFHFLPKKIEKNLDASFEIYFLRVFLVSGNLVC